MTAQVEEKVVQIATVNITRSPLQPRKRFDETALTELAESMRQRGVIQPIVVRSLNGTGENFELIAGERRLRAALQINLKTIPAIVREYTDEEAADVILIENLQREDLTIIEEAHGLKMLMERHGEDFKVVAEKVGKSPTHVMLRLALLTLPKYVQGLLDEGSLTAAHGQAILELEGEGVKIEAAKMANRLRLTAVQLRGRFQRDAKKKKRGATESGRGAGVVKFNHVSGALVRLFDYLNGFEFKKLNDERKRQILRQQIGLVERQLAEAKEKLG